MNITHKQGLKLEGHSRQIPSILVSKIALKKHPKMLLALKNKFQDLAPLPATTAHWVYTTSLVEPGVYIPLFHYCQNQLFLKDLL